MLVDYFKQEVALHDLPHISILDWNNTTLDNNIYQATNHFYYYYVPMLVDYFKQEVALHELPHISILD